MTNNNGLRTLATVNVRPTADGALLAYTPSNAAWTTLAANAPRNLLDSASPETLDALRGFARLSVPELRLVVDHLAALGVSADTVDALTTLHGGVRTDDLVLGALTTGRVELVVNRDDEAVVRALLAALAGLLGLAIAQAGVD